MLIFKVYPRHRHTEDRPAQPAPILAQENLSPWAGVRPPTPIKVNSACPPPQHLSALLAPTLSPEPMENTGGDARFAIPHSSWVAAGAAVEN